MADLTFEAKFAQLAGNQLSDKLPSMQDYFVGFQLLDKSDDETRAVGVNVFTVNGLWVYNPVFFLKGEIKGLQDLLYIKQKDMFVPAMDNWISALKDQGIDSLNPGKVKKNSGRYGSKSTKEKSFAAHQVPFDEMLFSTSQTTDGMVKTSSANDMVTEADFHMMTKLGSTDWNLGLDKQLACMPKQAQDIFFNTVASNADFANAVLRFYSPESIQSMASMMKVAAATVQNESTSPAEDKLLIVDSMQHPAAKRLSTAEKKLLTQNGVFVRDNRSNHSLLFKTEVKQSALENPTVSGVYDVLLADGSMKPFIILVGVQGVNDGCCFESTTKNTDKNVGRMVALIPLSDTTTYMTEKASKLFIRPTSDKESYKKVAGRVGRVATKRAFNTGTETYGNLLMVQPSTQAAYVFQRQGANKLHFTDTATKNSIGRSSDEGCIEPEFTGEDGRLLVQGGVVVIPKDVKTFTEMSYDGRPHFGDMNTINRMVFKEAEMHPLQIIVRPSGVTIRSEKVNATMDKTAAIRHLVEKEGITGSQAYMSIHHDAKGRPDGSVKYFIKYAFDYDINNNQEVKQNISRNEETGPTYTVAMQPARPLMPQDAIQQAVKASENGNRQVFDVTVLNNLVQAADVSELRKSFITDMLKGMDKTGRLLFIYYWHNDQFSERFGKEDLAALEDKIRQVFRNTGDLILYLKEKMPLETGTQEHILGSLSEDIGSSDDASSK